MPIWDGCRQLKEACNRVQGTADGAKQSGAGNDVAALGDDKDPSTPSAKKME